MFSIIWFGERKKYCVLLKSKIKQVQNKNIHLHQKSLILSNKVNDFY